MVVALTHADIVPAHWCAVDAWVSSVARCGQSREMFEKKIFFDFLIDLKNKIIYGSFCSPYFKNS